MTVTVTKPVGCSRSSHRLFGLDLARAVAICGMVVVHFTLVFAPDAIGPAWLKACTDALQGRAAATFVVLAGIGTTLGAARRPSPGWRLVARGVFLFVLGVGFLQIWPGDILRCYGVWMLFAAALLRAPLVVWLLIAVLVEAGGAAFLLWGDYFAHWDLAQLEYRGIGEPARFVRNLLFDGWNPLFPWFALYLLGMVLGRLDLRDRMIRAWLASAATVVLFAAHGLEAAFAPELWGWLGPVRIEPGHLLMTTSFPPTPMFVEAGASVAVLVILLCCELTERLPTWLTWPGVAMGQMALTLYLAHVVIGLGGFELLGYSAPIPLGFATAAAGVFCLLALIGCLLWRSRFTTGPVEGLMRRLTP